MKRSEKKAKSNGEQFSGESSMPVSYADLYQNSGDNVTADKAMSYKQTLLGEDAEMHGLQVVEQQVGGYDCPMFQLSRREETRIHKPWKQGLIVKLFGRRIGYKALENRLKQMWVRKGVISIIDLGKEYFLVYFSNEEDYNKALEDGPWLIYDHYLIVRQWSPNFYPNEATIDSASVWVRIPDLPIEYYDAKVLHFIGDRIGKMVKVDKNTLFQERGKYARLCVEVDLTKTLLATFELKGRFYKIEYEGLHMLCRTCGKLSHYIEGCPEKKTTTQDGSQNHQAQRVASTDSRSDMEKNNHESNQGPWVVVQKPRRNRKISGGAGGSSGSIKTSGSKDAGTRFQVLESINEEETNHADERQTETEKEEFVQQHVKYNKSQKGRNKLANTSGIKRSNDERLDETIVANNDEPTIMRNKSNGINNSKNHGDATGTEEENMETNIVMSQVANGNTSASNISHSNELETTKKETTRKHTRPPDNINLGSIPFIVSHSPMKEGDKGDLMTEGETFVDANDQGTNEGSDSDMEVVGETPNHPQ
ncbi:hypothetical protein P8452_06530 [Trifolium repens]|nr:hypothetical protein P8452_06530 [Trifolium repens]